MRVSYEGDPDIAKEFVTKALQEMFRLETRMAVYGRQQGTFQHVLNDDTYCYGYSLPGGLRAVHIVAPPAPVEDMPLFTRTKLPDFVSGVLTAAYITEGKKGAPDTMSAIYPTMQSWRVHQQEFSAPAACRRWPFARAPAVPTRCESPHGTALQSHPMGL